jgi:hypothetical protein
MTTVVIDTRTKEAKQLVEYLKTIKYVKVVDNQKEKMDYSPSFVKKIKERENQPSVKVDLDKLWK